MHGANGMKMKRDHIVPLSRQSIAILRDLHQNTGHQALIFPAVGPKKRPLSDVTLNQALHLLGYPSSVHVPHGFRTTASTLLHELGYNSDDIEIQLAHTDSNKIREIYKRAERLAERKRMMQEYSDYLDQLRDSVKVASIDLSAITPLMKASTAASDQRTA
jgi:integrase